MAVVVRIYEDPTRASDAYKALRAEHFGESSVALLIPKQGQTKAPEVALDSRETAATHSYQPPYSAPSSEPLTSVVSSPQAPAKADATAEIDLASAVRIGSLIGDNASFYLDYFDRGYALVAVAPAFGKAVKATQILNQHDPFVIQEASPETPPAYQFIRDQSAPLSSALGLGVLCDPHWSLSRSFGFGTLSHGRSFLARWFGELGDPHYSLTASFPLLSDKPSPLSSTLGLPTLSSKSTTGWKRSMGLRLLSSNAAPLSGFFGIPLLKGRYDSRDYAPLRHRRDVRHQAAPLSKTLSLGVLSNRFSFLSRMFAPLTRHDFTLSSMFGMKLLSQNAAPLSSMLGMKTVRSVKGGEWHSSMGLPLLSSNPTPLSDMFGLPVRSQR